MIPLSLFKIWRLAIGCRHLGFISHIALESTGGMKIRNRFVQVLRSIILIGALFLWGCESNRETQNNSSINPDGVFAQLLRIDAQDKSEGFESLMAQLVQVADSVGLENPYYWICYREAPDHYWLLTISDSLDNFVHPGSIEGFAASIGRFATLAEQDRISSMSVAMEALFKSRDSSLIQELRMLPGRSSFCPKVLPLMACMTTMNFQLNLAMIKWRYSGEFKIE